MSHEGVAPSLGGKVKEFFQKRRVARIAKAGVAAFGFLVAHPEAHAQNSSRDEISPSCMHSTTPYACQEHLNARPAALRFIVALRDATPHGFAIAMIKNMTPDQKVRAMNTPREVIEGMYPEDILNAATSKSSVFAEAVSGMTSDEREQLAEYLRQAFLERWEILNKEHAAHAANR